jgi:hypothetical protein
MWIMNEAKEHIHDAGKHKFLNHEFVVACAQIANGPQAWSQ